MLVKSELKNLEFLFFRLNFKLYTIFNHIEDERSVPLLEISCNTSMKMFLYTYANIRVGIPRRNELSVLTTTENGTGETIGSSSRCSVSGLLFARLRVFTASPRSSASFDANLLFRRFL